MYEAFYVNLIFNIFTILCISTSLIIITVLKIFKKNKRELNTTNDVIEIFFLIYSILYSIGKLWWFGNNDKYETLCKIQGLLKIYSVYGIYINMLILNYLMIKVIKNPYKIIKNLKVKIFMIQLILLLIVSIMYFCDIFGYNRISKTSKECSFVDKNIILFNIFFFGFFFIPLIILVAITIVINIKIKIHIKSYSNELIEKIMKITRFYPLIIFLTCILNIILSFAEFLRLKNNIFILITTKLFSGVQGLLFLIIFLYKRKEYFIKSESQIVINHRTDVNSNLF